MKKFLLLWSILPALIFAAPAAPEAVLYDFEVVRVIDGDTVVFQADFLPAPLNPELSVRVYGVDTPEKSWRAQCDKEKQLGEAAGRFATDLINRADNVQIAIMKWDKFGGRVIGDVVIDGKSLAVMLIENGYAREYHGGKKESWCK